MTDTLTPPQSGPQDKSIYEVPQQFLLGEEISPEQEFALARGCVVHCAAAALDQEHAPTTNELADFIVQYGAGSGSEMYQDGAGWKQTAVADLLRHDGYSVISQNLNYGSDETNLEQMTEAGRVRSDFEKERLLVLSEHGGKSRENWLTAIEHSTMMRGKAVVSIRIPLLSGDGYGDHAVLVHSIDDEFVTYFDPDYYLVQRHGENPPDIQRVDEEKMIYRRPRQDFLGAMSGNVMHLYQAA